MCLNFFAQMTPFFLFISLVAPTSLLAASSEKTLNWNSSEGMQRLERSKAKADFFALANHFESQTNRIYCGVASSVIVLNALRPRGFQKPRGDVILSQADQKYLSGRDPFFERYTQKNIMEKSPKSIFQVLGKPEKKNGKEMRDFGFQLRQLDALLRAHQLKTTVRVVNDQLKIDWIRNELRKNLQTQGDFVLVNYSRKALGQKGGGHLSPLGAYDAQSDSFLILDVNPNKADWVWVTTQDLVHAMRTFDTVENRGYLLIRD